jgi:hypothetical protein
MQDTALPGHEQPGGARWSRPNQFQITVDFLRAPWTNTKKFVESGIETSRIPTFGPMFEYDYICLFASFGRSLSRKKISLLVAVQ